MFEIKLSQIQKFGRDLVRPEGVMCLKDGTVWTSHGEGHCTRIAPDGSQKNLGELGGEPNGICIDRDGSVIIANIGNGQVQRMYADGRSTGRIYVAQVGPFGFAMAALALAIVAALALLLVLGAFVILIPLAGLVLAVAVAFSMFRGSFRRRW